MQGDTPTAIVEFKDADDATRAITLCNGGAMGLSRAALEKYLPQLSNDNAQGEYYCPILSRWRMAAAMAPLSLWRMPKIQWVSIAVPVRPRPRH